MKNKLQKVTSGLAGAVAIAGGSQAYGAVVSVTVPANISANATTTPATTGWDINGDGVTDFFFGAVVGSGTSSSGAAYAFSIGGLYSAYAASTTFGVDNKTVGYTTSYGTYASRLAANTSIGSTSTFVYSAQYLTLLASRFNGKSYGALRTRGFVGFQFTAADGLHYGYINLQSTVAGTGTTSANYTAAVNFFSAAYQSTPNTPILAGATAVPEPTSLAALAFGAAGAAGAAAYRRKKATKAVA